MCGSRKGCVWEDGPNFGKGRDGHLVAVWLRAPPNENLSLELGAPTSGTRGGVTSLVALHS